MTALARSRILEMQPRLLASARSHTPDVNLAHALVHHTLVSLMEHGGSPEPLPLTQTGAAAMVRRTIDRMSCFRGLRRAAPGP
jgi:hypothetical protein